ncbi:benzoate/H(+) symporter BenE family transporter [Rhodobacteraceae bacterium D3-12]|nr:benzoate/H(+) symporter BenE family transporter [Rhodobacteraceae bacterium D3-12]
MTSKRAALQPLTTGFVVAIVGFFSSFPIVLQGLVQVGASPAQAASGLMAAAVAMGLAGIVLSLWQKMPVSVAWSTPGAALLAVTAPDAAGFGGAVAGFIVAGVLTVVAGFWRPLARLATAIPAPVTQAMLAGVLLSICAAPVAAVAEVPQYVLPIIVTWFVVGRFARLFSTPAAVVAMVVVIVAANDFALPVPDQVLSQPVFVAPVFSLGAIVGIGLPLFVVTMATQNVPGMSILSINGFHPPAGPMFSGVGGFSVLSAPFGAPATCLAAITAAMCASEDAHPDPARRYMAAVWAGGFYCVLGVFAGLITALTAIAPEHVLATLAGVALISVFAGSAAGALQASEGREAAALTFVVTASGVSFFGLGAAVWGLVVGCIAWGFRAKG